MRLIDADEVRLQKGFFDKVTNVPKFYEWLDSLPTVDAVPVVHGRWKPWDLTFGRSVYACSVCGEGENVPTVMGKPMFSYCPNCGALMDLDGERKDGDA